MSSVLRCLSGSKERALSLHGQSPGSNFIPCMSSFLRFVSALVHMWVLTGRGHDYQRAVSFTFGE